jgi:hypothetical protein
VIKPSTFVLRAVYDPSTTADQLASALFGKCCHVGPMHANPWRRKRNAYGSLRARAVAPSRVATTPCRAGKRSTATATSQEVQSETRDMSGWACDGSRLHGLTESARFFRNFFPCLEKFPATAGCEEDRAGRRPGSKRVPRGPRADVRRDGRSVRASRRSSHPVPRGLDPLPRPVPLPLAEVAVDGSPVRVIVREHPPRTSAAAPVEDRIDHGSHRHPPIRADGPAARDEVANRIPFNVRQIAWIARYDSVHGTPPRPVGHCGRSRKRAAGSEHPTMALAVSWPSREESDAGDRWADRAREGPQVRRIGERWRPCTASSVGGRRVQSTENTWTFGVVTSKSGGLLGGRGGTESRFRGPVGDFPPSASYLRRALAPGSQIRHETSEASPVRGAGRNPTVLNKRPPASSGIAKASSLAVLLGPRGRGHSIQARSRRFRRPNRWRVSGWNTSSAVNRWAGS